MSDKVPPPPPPPPPPSSSPPISSPGSSGRRGSSTSTFIQLSPKSIKRSSLRLSQSWSKRNVLQNHDNDNDDDLLPPNLDHKNKNDYDDDDDDDDELIQLAFFPTLNPAVLAQADAAATATAATATDASTKTKKKEEAAALSFSQVALKVQRLSAAAAAEAEAEDFTSTAASEVSVGDASIFSNITASGVWQDVPMGAPDAILGIAQAYRACTDPNKVNVCVGAYRDEHGQPWVLPSVRAAERILLECNENKEYLPIAGDPEFLVAAMQFSYGPDMDLDHIAAVQTLSGTGACRVGGLFLAQFWPNHPIYVPDPTWGNHIAIFKQAGLVVKKYRYYDRRQNGVDLQGMLRDLTKAPDGSIILLHACAHNPTGCDLTIEEWKQVVSVISEKEHIAFFDSAYQGFASGDAENDAQPFRYAVSQHVPVLLAQSFAKNFGLYGERCGTLSVVCGDAGQKERILSELCLIIRPMYSSPPRHGSSIVKTILMDEDLKAQYYKECASMAQRIQTMRVALVKALQDAGSKHDWSHITRQIGMFAFTGLSEDMCKQLTEEYSIFLTTNGRISVAGLNDSNVGYVANAIHMVSDGKSITMTD